MRGLTRGGDSCDKCDMDRRGVCTKCGREERAVGSTWGKGCLAVARRARRAEVRREAEARAGVGTAAGLEGARAELAAELGRLRGKR